RREPLRGARRRVPAARARGRRAAAARRVPAARRVSRRSSATEDTRSGANSGIVRGPASRRRSQDDRSGATPRVRVPLKKARFRIAATASPGPGEPPQTLAAFYWHFIRQTKGWYAGMFFASLCVALLDTVIPLIIGRLVALMAAEDRVAAIAASWPMLA